MDQTFALDDERFDQCWRDLSDWRRQSLVIMNERTFKAHSQS